MSYIIKVLDTGEVHGYIPLEDFAVKHGVTSHALRKEIERGYLKTLVIGEGRDRKYYFPENYSYIKPKRGRPKRKEE